MYTISQKSFMTIYRFFNLLIYRLPDILKNQQNGKFQRLALWHAKGIILYVADLVWCGYVGPWVSSSAGAIRKFMQIITRFGMDGRCNPFEDPVNWLWPGQPQVWCLPCDCGDNISIACWRFVLSYLMHFPLSPLDFFDVWSWNLHSYGAKWFLSQIVHYSYG